MNKDYLKGHWYAYTYDQEVIQDDVQHILSIIEATVGAAPQRVLEVACGSGRISVPLAQAGHTVTGFDIDEYMLGRIPPKAIGLANLFCYQADALLEEWGSGFDIVVMGGSMLHNIVTNGDYQQAQEQLIQKTASCVKQGGYLYLDFDCVNWPDSIADENMEWVVFEGTDDIGTFGRYIVLSGDYSRETRINSGSRRYEITPVDGEMFSVVTQSVKYFPKYEQVISWLEKYGWNVEWQAPVSQDTFHAIIWAKKKE